MTDGADRTPLPSLAQLEGARNQVIRELGTHFAEDHLTVEELETRIERALRASSTESLQAVLAGLPDLPGDALSPESGLIPDRAESRSPAPHDQRKTIAAFMGSVVRRGIWTVPADLRVLALMGGVELDLRHARLSPGITHVHAIAILGAVAISVPPSVRVESDGIAILGGFDDLRDHPASAMGEAPVIQLTGFSFMGGVEVKAEHPGTGRSPIGPGDSYE